ncbi:hypothetical protein GCM10011519_05920 [Marmoricola endophyticus]|uniref:O-antigen/teichoic acid export membrane protein n=1 Tax=Marmoricola endophyticus TaxID=2040280 RepID=A0A917BEU7_9ACTN|nr:hypothetical protein [Marmoricola endophyticus]GGF35309.1 hypothetical protein GCM10011519_05920 [Marmoricola endophyticus]
MSHDRDLIPPATTDAADERAFLTDGVSLGFSAVASALVGLLGWLLAARLLDPTEVGRASAFVNAFVFCAGVAELGLGQACLKWLPRAGAHTHRILTRVYVGVIASALVVSVVWGVATRGSLSSQMGLTAHWAVLLFVLASLAWTLLHVQNFVLTGLGAARWVPVEMLTFGVARIVLLVALAHPYGALGVVWSWVVPTALAVLVLLAVLLVRRRRLDGRPGELPTRQAAVRMAGSIYVSTFGMTLMISLVPLVVTATYGPALGAVFFIVWNGVAAIEQAAAGFASALVVRLSGDSVVLLRQALRRVLPLFGVPLLLAAAVSAPLLHVFGGTYPAEGTTLLRLVCLGLLVRVIGSMVVGIHLAADRTVRLVLVNTVPALAMVLAVVTLPVHGSLTLLGVAYVVIQVVVSGAAVLDLALARDPGSAGGRVPADER